MSKTSKITFVLSDALHKKFKRHAIKEGGNITKHLTGLIKKDLKG